MYGFVCKILLDFAGFFRCFKVNFNLQKTSAEVNSVYFLSLISLECFLAFRLLFKFDNQLHFLVCFNIYRFLDRGQDIVKFRPLL